jgi:hypothetical protein
MKRIERRGTEGRNRREGLKEGIIKEKKKL